MTVRRGAGSASRLRRRRPRITPTEWFGSPNPDDLITMIDRIVSSAESAEEETVTLETGVARYMLERTKRAAKEGHGRKVLSQHAKTVEEQILSQARRRKAELVAKGMPKEQAEEQAAEEASAEFGKNGRNLAPSTIKRRMQRRR
jgi:hypothetical protein